MTQTQIQDGVGPGSPNGAAVSAGSTETAPAKKRRGPAVVAIPLLLVMLVAAGFFVARYLQDQATYVSTDNATISGALLQIGSLNSGQIASVGVDIGDAVKKDQSVAVVTLPSAISSAQGTAKLGFRGTDDLQVHVTSPSDGVVVARGSNPGDTVAAGQSLVTIVDPTKFWVQAQIEETKVGRVRVGQTVDVTVDALGQTIPGKVVAVGRASAATFSLMPAGNTSGNFTKVTQLVPVKIAIDYGQLPLTLGSSVEVKIRVAE